MRTRAGALHEAVGFFVVRAAEPDPSTPLLVLTTDTWNAYDDFGGPDVLTGGAPASFARPMAHGTRCSWARPSRTGDGPVTDRPDR